MTDYNNFTNAELEEEMERLTKEYEEVQEITELHYARMLELSEQYYNAKLVLNRRLGKTTEKTATD